MTAIGSDTSLGTKVARGGRRVAMTAVHCILVSRFKEVEIHCFYPHCSVAIIIYHVQRKSTVWKGKRQRIVQKDERRSVMRLFKDRDVIYTFFDRVGRPLDNVMG